MNKVAVMGLLHLYEKGQASYEELRRKISQYSHISGEDRAIIRELISKGYILEGPKEVFSINPIFDSFKADFGVSLSGTLGERTGVYTNPVFHSRAITRDPKLCFILMPFRDPFIALYDDHISKVVKSTGLTCRKADEIFGPSQIMEDIWKSIFSAHILIADLTGRNPNVFYEVGIAHTLGRQVILISQNVDDVPFDLRHLRFFKYEFTPRGMQELETNLQKSIEEILRFDLDVA